MINLTRGVPPVEVFPIEDLICASMKSLRESGKQTLQYVHAPGYLPLRDWLAEYNSAQPEQVFMGNSSLELLHFLTMVLIKPGARVFVEGPSYDRANTLMKRSGAEVVDIRLQTDGVDLDAFEKELKQGAPVLFYIIDDFQNPMGTTTSLEKRQQLVAWAREYNFWIAEDAPYRPLRYYGEPVPTMYSLAPDRVIMLSSFSKTLAPGLRMGYLVGDAGIVKQMHDWAVDTYIGPVTPTQGMVYEYFKADLLEPNIRRLCDLYRPRLDAMIAAVDQYLPGSVYPRPEGGFFVGVTLPEGNCMDDLLPKAEKAGLKLTDGRGFFLNSVDGDRFLRLPFCSLTPDEIESAMQILAPLVVK